MRNQTENFTITAETSTVIVTGLVQCH